MIINHNISSIFANRQYKINNWNMDANLEKLSSGLKINKAGDDASGLAVSEKMRAQIRGLWRAEKNVEDGISFIQTTEGYLEQTTQVLQRLRELAVQASNGIYTDEDRLYIQVEVSQLVAEVDRIASHAQFNGLTMLTGRFAKRTETVTPTASMWIHVGANMDQRLNINIEAMTAVALGIKDGATGEILSLSSPEKANRAIGVLDQALQKVNKQRADLGAYQNRFMYTAKALLIGYENLQAAESRIRDTDMAYEISDFVKNQILAQSSISMISQANLRPQAILTLLR
ncbi:MAG: flagellin [Spirochaetia bacterium]|nr:flagellin [Spirochaetota bacterium]MCX8096946.1 flagellin [Spirochaetota bacterium]MDW8112413.1 flagellin [Spirochaetia bacterium]